MGRAGLGLDDAWHGWETFKLWSGLNGGATRMKEAKSGLHRGGEREREQLSACRWWIRWRCRRKERDGSVWGGGGFELV